MNHKKLMQCLREPENEVLKQCDEVFTAPIGYVSTMYALRESHFDTLLLQRRQARVESGARHANECPDTKWLYEEREDFPYGGVRLHCTPTKAEVWLGLQPERDGLCLLVVPRFSFPTDAAGFFWHSVNPCRVRGGCSCQPLPGRLLPPPPPVAL